MLTAVLRRVDDDQEGFTLVELMVVVLIIAILLAIAIPTFLGARTRAQDRAAQASLKLALTAERIYFVDNNVYTAAATTLTLIEPTLTYVPGLSPPGSPVTNKIGISLDTTTSIVCLTATSASGTVFAMADESVGANPGTYYFSGQLTACDGTVSAGASHF
jgi:type IV pilus assembly protein PilA